MDPERTEDQAKALAATRRILAVMRLEVAGGGGEEASLGDRDQQLLAGHDAEGLTEDLSVFAEWHRAAVAESAGRGEGGVGP